LEWHKARKQAAVLTAHVEKDRTGILAGQTIAWPTYDKLARPLLGPWRHAGDDAEGGRSGPQDAEALARQEAEQLQRSAELAAAHTTRIGAAETVAALQQVGGELTARSRWTSRAGLGPRACGVFPAACKAESGWMQRDNALNKGSQQRVTAAVGPRRPPSGALSLVEIHLAIAPPAVTSASVRGPRPAMAKIASVCRSCVGLPRAGDFGLPAFVDQIDARHREARHADCQLFWRLAGVCPLGPTGLISAAREHCAPPSWLAPASPFAHGRLQYSRSELDGYCAEEFLERTPMRRCILALVAITVTVAPLQGDDTWPQFAAIAAAWSPRAPFPNPGPKENVVWSADIKGRGWVVAGGLGR